MKPISRALEETSRRRRIAESHVSLLRQERVFMYDFVIIGGSIVGLSTTMALGQRYLQAKIAVLKKENISE